MVGSPPRRSTVGLEHERCSGAGLDEAVRGVRVVVHAATRPGRDVTGVRQLVAAARRTDAQPEHAEGRVTFASYLAERDGSAARR